MGRATEEEITLLGFDPKDLACKCCGVCRVELALLQRMRCFFDFTRKLDFEITSCCRCWDHHVEVYKRLYGAKWETRIAKRSTHLITDDQGNELESCAMDITGLPLHLEAVDVVVGKVWLGGYHFYNGNTPSIHLDINRKRRWR